MIKFITLKQRKGFIVAEVKIKDLIRKLVFQNKHAEHEYTEQMANIVFDRNDTAIENAYTESEKIDTKIKKNQRGLGQERCKNQGNRTR